jgi:hypothetical protein
MDKKDKDFLIKVSKQAEDNKKAIKEFSDEVLGKLDAIDGALKIIESGGKIPFMKRVKRSDIHLNTINPASQEKIDAMSNEIAIFLESFMTRHEVRGINLNFEV